jgi:hypothetical protein
MGRQGPNAEAEPEVIYTENDRETDLECGEDVNDAENGGAVSCMRRTG